MEVLCCTPSGMGSLSLPLETDESDPGPSNGKEEGYRVWGQPQDAASWLLSFHVPKHSGTCCFLSLVLRPLEKLPTTPYPAASSVNPSCWYSSVAGGLAQAEFVGNQSSGAELKSRDVKSAHTAYG